MNRKVFKEIKPGNKYLKKFYIAVMLWIVGRAIQAASKVDREVKEEFASLREDFTVRLRVAPSGPAMVVGRVEKSGVRYFGSSAGDREITLDMMIKNIEGAMTVFTFRESTCQAFCNERFVVSGDIPDALVFVRILNLVEVFLLPKIIASFAVKRYPSRSTMGFMRKYVGRVLIYIRAFTF